MKYKLIDIFKFAAKRNCNLQGCWPWLGNINSNGRPVFQDKLAYRVAFYFSNGYWPELVRHLCGNKICVNPAHLRAGTLKQNKLDSIRHGTSYVFGRKQSRGGRLL